RIYNYGWRKLWTCLGPVLTGSQRKAISPISRETWDAQYRSGYWARLHDVSEVPHNSMIVGLLSRLKPNATILDVGCGEGVLFLAIRPYGYKAYVGIDLSAVAIMAIASAADDRTTFIVTDAEAFTPVELFDVIIFNESLYYLRDPLTTLRRYISCLAPDGLVI